MNYNTLVATLMDNATGSHVLWIMVSMAHNLVWGGKQRGTILHKSSEGLEYNIWGYISWNIAYFWSLTDIVAAKSCVKI